MSSFLLGLLAVLFPPLPVWIKRGICSADSFINLALCCLGWLPGLIHAIYIIVKYPEEHWCYHQQGYQPIDAEQGGNAGNAGNARVYVYTASYPSAAAHTQPRKSQGQSGPQHYGTVNTNNNARPAQQNNNNAKTGGNGGESTAANGPQFLPSVAPETNGEGSSAARPQQDQQQSQQPPSYSDVVKGDFKVQTHD